MKYLRSVFCSILLSVALTSLSANSITAYNNQTVYETQNHVFRKNELAQGFVRLNNGFTVLPQSCVNMDVLFTISGGIDLRETSTIRMLKDLEFDSGVTLTTGGNIDGRGHTLILNGDFRIPANKVLHFNGDTILDARGNEIIIGENAEIFVDTNVTLTIANATIKTTRNAPTFPALRCGAQTSKLALDNVVFAPINDFLFQNGQLFIHNDVVVTGTSAFIYHSPAPSFITKNSCLYLDHALTFSMAPATFTDAPYSLNNTYTNNNFIKMADETSVLYLNGCSLETTITGWRLTKGTVGFDDRVQAKTDTTLTLTSLSLRSRQSYQSNAVHSVNWSPDGNYLAIAGSNIASSDELQVYHFNGTSLTLIAQATFGGFFQLGQTVSWSPDGRYLALGGFFTPSATYNLLIYRFDGTSLILLPATQITLANTVRSVNWSPDGHYLAIGDVLPTGGFVTMVYTFDGTSLMLIQALVNDLDACTSVNWSPDGNYLAIGGSSSTGGYVLQVYSFNGKTLTLLPGTRFTFGDNLNSVNWSPDGRYLAIGGYNPTSGYELQVYRFDGTNLVLVPGARVHYGLTIFSVMWSPDGRYLAVGGETPVVGHTTVEVYSFDGVSLTVISASQIAYSGRIEQVNWMADGRYLAIGGSPTGGFQPVEVYKVNYVNNTTPQAVTSSMVWGDSAKGDAYDAHLRLQPGASLNLTGKMLYDNVN
jgi:WD40 repeat protein